MKGICGFYNLDSRPAESTRLDAMRTALPVVAHQQAWGSVRDSVALGALCSSPATDAVLDPAHCIHPETGCIVVADALLVEPEALCNALGLPWTTSVADVDLIASAWLRWQEACVERLDGDFAFAVFDPRRQVLFLARDGMGVRPLYVHHAAGRLFAFASSSTALLAHGAIPATLNEGRIADYLVSQLEGIDQTSTFYAAVERLPPGTTTTVDTRTVVRRSYWLPGDDPSPPLPRSDEQWVEAVRNALTQAVVSRMRGATRIGSMISGGMDSSAVAAIAAAQLASASRGPLPTFSGIDSANAGCVETAAIRAMCAQPGFAPTFFELADIDRWPAEFCRLADAFEEPFDSDNHLIHAQYFRAAETGVDAVLDGIDADSLFSEGDYLARQLRSGHWLRAWREAHGLREVYGEQWTAPRQLLALAPRVFVPRALRSALRPLRRKAMVRQNVRLSLISSEFAERIDLAGRLARNRKLRSELQGGPNATEAIATMASPSLTAGLERYHRTAAVHGIEPRHPFVDRRLMALCLNMPDDQRARAGWNKYVLRSAMGALLPEAVTRRRSKEHLGFAFAQANFRRGPRDRMQELDQVRAVLAPYVDGARLDQAIAASARDDFKLELVMEALTLAGWLGRNAPRRGETLVIPSPVKSRRPEPI